MILSFSKLQIISIIVWSIILLLSNVLFFNTLYFIPSLILYILSLSLIIYGYYITFTRKHIYFFTPILQTIYCSFFYVCIIGLFYFSKYNFLDLFSVPTNNESLLIIIALLYFIYVVCIFIPYLFSRILNLNLQLKISFFKRFFNYRRLNNYFKYSFIYIVIMLIFMFITTGFSPIDALLDPHGFKMKYVRGIAYSCFIQFSTFLFFNVVLCLYLKLIKNYNTKFFNKFCILLGIFYLFFGFISGSRSVFLFPAIMFIYIYSMKPKIKISIALIIKFFIIFSSILIFISGYFVYRNVMHEIKNNNLPSIQLPNKVPVMTILVARVDNFSNSVHYFNYIDKQNNGVLEYNEYSKFIEQVSSIFTQLLPRKIFPDKGYWIQNELTNKLFPEMHITNRDITFVFGGIVTIFQMGGIVALIISSLSFGTFIAILQFNFKRIVAYDYSAILYIFIFLNIPILYFTEGFIGTPRIYNLIINCILLPTVLYFITEKKLFLRSK